MHADEYRDGKISRREFMARATSLGVTATAAYGLIGAVTPARAASHIQPGGTLRIQQEVHGLTDPRLYEWSEMGNISRGWLEHLVAPIYLCVNISPQQFVNHSITNQIERLKRERWLDPAMLERIEASDELKEMLKVPMFRIADAFERAGGVAG